MRKQARPTPGERLCLACGMCCDGTLFGRVRLSDEERRRLQGRIALREESQELAQPCRALEGLRCTVYADRPKGCCDFECEVLRSLKARQLSSDDALAKVARARELVDAVAAALPAREADEPHGVMARVRLRETQALSPEAFDAVVRLRRFLLLHFGA